MAPNDKEPCAFTEKCPIFIMFCQDVQNIYLNLYCLNHYQQCKRRALRLSGQNVPPNMLPNGRMMADPDEVIEKANSGKIRTVV